MEDLNTVITLLTVVVAILSAVIVVMLVTLIVVLIKLKKLINSAHDATHNIAAAAKWFSPSAVFTELMQAIRKK